MTWALSFERRGGVDPAQVGQGHVEDIAEHAQTRCAQAVAVGEPFRPPGGLVGAAVQMR
ncbi:hypothetical protein [Leucobacter soli]|uniref:hypothetical protein n=1 Tax=Leucobacter soli TaxID=2812850 RepID=UPI00361B2900